MADVKVMNTDTGNTRIFSASGPIVPLQWWIPGAFRQWSAPLEIPIASAMVVSDGKKAYAYWVLKNEKQYHVEIPVEEFYSEAARAERWVRKQVRRYEEGLI